MGAAPVMQPVVVFAVYTGPMGARLTASTAFYAIALFGLLRQPLLFLPFGVMTFLQSLAASKRIGDLLAKDDADDDRGACGAPSGSSLSLIERETNSEKGTSQTKTAKKPSEFTKGRKGPSPLARNVNQL